MDCFKEPFWICWQPKWHRCWRRPWWWRRLWQICGSGSNQSRGRQKVVASLSRHSRRPEWPVNRDLRPVFFFKCYLLVIDELCNCSSEEVDEQRRKNNDNSVDNICDGENLNRRGEYILFIYLIPQTGEVNILYLFILYQVDSEQALPSKESGDHKESVKSEGKKILHHRMLSRPICRVQIKK